MSKKKKKDRVSMSIWTSFALSANNLRTKKRRTFTTSFAGSIGIIGIALILAISNGVNDYIQSIEEETLASYPLEITSTQLDISSLLTSRSSDVSTDDPSENNDEDEISVVEITSTLFSQTSSNDLASLKEYLDSGESGIEEYVTAIEYEYDYDVQIYYQTDDANYQVNPDSNFSVSGSSFLSSMISSYSSSSAFYSLPESESLYIDQYEVVAGKWPENYNEAVLVLTSSGSISDYMAYMLGLRDYGELEEMLEQYASGQEVTSPGVYDNYSYEDVIGTTYKVVCAADYYTYDEEYGLWIEKTGDALEETIDNGEDLVIVGVVKPTEDAISATLTTGVNYTFELIEHMAQLAQESEIVQAQLADPGINVYTGEEFGEESSEFDMSSLISIDEDALNDLFDIGDLSSYLTFDTSSLTDIEIDWSGIDLSQAIDLSSLEIEIDWSGLDVNAILSEITFDEADVEQLVNDLLEGYAYWQIANSEAEDTSFQTYLVTEEAVAIIEEFVSSVEANVSSEAINTIIDAYVADITSQVEQQITEALTVALQETMEEVTTQLTSQIAAAMEKEMANMASQLTKALSDALSFDEEDLMNVFQFNADSDTLTQMLLTMSQSESTDYSSNLSSLGYLDLTSPSEVDIYPIDFDSKDAVVAILDDYNEQMEASGQEEKKILYTDLVATMMGSVTTIINVVTYVLIAFVAVSLIVSCIMISVITQISVMES